MKQHDSMSQFPITTAEVKILLEVIKVYVIHLKNNPALETERLYIPILWGLRKKLERVILVDPGTNTISLALTINEIQAASSALSILMLFIQSTIPSEHVHHGTLEELQSLSQRLANLLPCQLN